MLRRLLDTVLRRAKPTTTSPLAKDYVGDRESERIGNLSAEDRAWEEAASQRSRETTARADADRASQP